MWFKPQEENFMFWFSVESEFSVATKVSCALGGNLMEAFLNLNDSEKFNFLLATYAKASSCFSFSIIFKALWFMEVAWLMVAKGGITFLLSLSDLVLVTVSVEYFSLQFSGNGTVSQGSVSLVSFNGWSKTWSSLHWCYMHVNCWLGRKIASRVLVSNGLLASFQEKQDQLQMNSG